MSISSKAALFLSPLAIACMAGCGAGTTAATIVTPAPTPDFTLAVSPPTVTIAPGSSGTVLTVLATASGSFTGTVTLSIDGLPSGVTTTPASPMLTPGVSQILTLNATSKVVTGPYTVTFTGVSGSLRHPSALSLIVSSTGTTATGIDVTTYHYDNARDGLNAQESTLTLDNVKATSFGLVGLYPVDGKVDAQPLLVSGLAVPQGSTSTANLLFVPTEHGSVYAFDATTGIRLWKTSTLGAGESTSDTHNCDQISPEIGITSTPVIDRTRGPNGAIFVVAMSKDSSGKYHQRLHALDLVNGAELSGSPTEIAATYPGTGAGSSGGSVVFDPGQYAERAGLLLLNNTIYTAWTSHCDQQPYTGWVIGYDESTLQRSTVLNLTPNGSEGSVWMSGYGLAADNAANIYFLDANGTLDPTFTSNGFPNKADYGNAMLKLSTSPSLAVADFFEPYNTVAQSNADLDLGSGGAMLLPDMTDNSGKTRHLIVGAGKDNNIYLADRDNMGKINQTSADNSNIYQELAYALPNGAWSGPAFFNNTLFYGGVGDALKAYTIANARLSASPTSKSAARFPYPGTTPAVSASGTQNGIVWAVESALTAPGVLHAYDASNLAIELYNSNQAAGGRDAFGNGNKFITPMIANGRVYVGTQNAVAVFGLISP